MINAVHSFRALAGSAKGPLEEARLTDRPRRSLSGDRRRHRQGQSRRRSHSRFAMRVDGRAQVWKLKVEATGQADRKAVSWG